MTTSSNVTQLLGAWRQGDANALEELSPYVYTELQRLARSIWREKPLDIRYKLLRSSMKHSCDWSTPTLIIETGATFMSLRPA